MQVRNRRNSMALVFFISGLIAFLTLALVSTTWAAPNAQGTVPTPPNPTAQPTTTGGGNNGGGSQDNSGGQNSGTDAILPTASAPGDGTVCAIGDEGAQCTVENLIIVVGAGAAPSGSALTIEGSFGQPPCPPSPEANLFLNRCYRYAWIGTAAELLPKINAPVQYCFNFGPEQLAAVDNKPETFLVGFADMRAQWTIVKPTIDPAANRVCATTNQGIVWSALFAPKPAAPLLPTVGGALNAWWMLPLAGLGIVMMFVAVRFARQGAR